MVGAVREGMVTHVAQPSRPAPSFVSGRNLSGSTIIDTLKLAKPEPEVKFGQTLPSRTGNFG